MSDDDNLPAQCHPIINSNNIKKNKLPLIIKDKIYTINGNKIKTYFPLSNNEKQIVRKMISNVEFLTIFADMISQKDWDKAKKQIKEKFQKELFDIKEHNS